MKKAKRKRLIQNLNQQINFFDEREHFRLTMVQFINEHGVEALSPELLTTLPHDLRALYEKAWRKQLSVWWLLFKIAVSITVKEFEDEQRND